MLHISGASASLKLRDLKPWFPGTRSDLHMYFRDNVFPSAISACGNLGQRSGRALLKFKDSLLLPNKHTNSAIPLQASFQVATSTRLPLSSLTGCFSGKETGLQAAHFSHSFASPVSLYSHRSFPAHLVSLTCFIYLLLYFQLFHHRAIFLLALPLPGSPSLPTGLCWLLPFSIHHVVTPVLHLKLFSLPWQHTVSSVHSERSLICDS